MIKMKFEFFVGSVDFDRILVYGNITEQDDCIPKDREWVTDPRYGRTVSISCPAISIYKSLKVDLYLRGSDKEQDNLELTFPNPVVLKNIAGITRCLVEKINSTKKEVVTEAKNVGTRLKLEAIKTPFGMHALRIVSQPGRGDGFNGGKPFNASNGVEIRSIVLPAYGVSERTLYLRGTSKDYDDRPFFVPDSEMDDIIEAVAEFNAA